MLWIRTSEPGVSCANATGSDQVPSFDAAPRERAYCKGLRRQRRVQSGVQLNTSELVAPR